MPNQLAKTKSRQSLAEHQAVLAALTLIAQCEKTSVMALLREAARELVRTRSLHMDVIRLSDVVWSKAPRMPSEFKSGAQVARFKRAQREFDQILLDLNLARPVDVQQRNSSVPLIRKVRILELDPADATTR